MAFRYITLGVVLGLIFISAAACSCRNTPGPGGETTTASGDNSSDKAPSEFERIFRNPSIVINSLMSMKHEDILPSPAGAQMDEELSLGMDNLSSSEAVDIQVFSITGSQVTSMHFTHIKGFAFADSATMAGIAECVNPAYADIIIDKYKYRYICCIEDKKSRLISVYDKSDSSWNKIYPR
ncbi:MAG: hypothetical protein OEZ32_13500 [Nitrospinota bacterium]|nr:hypothetical protein [Nitrospinota bacterium]